MRRTTVGTLALTALAIVGCGGSSHFANQPRPASPVNLTVFISEQRISVSPTTVGAGPIDFIVTNQASNAASLTILPAGASGAQPLAETGPISPQGTAQLTVDLSSPGDYTVGLAGNGTTEAAAASPTGISPALLHVGQGRPSSSNQLLAP